VPSRSHLTSCTPTKSNLYLDNSLAAAVNEPALYRFLTFQVPLSLLRLYQSISPGPRLCLWIFCNKICFNREELLAPCPTPKLEDNPLSAVRDCLFNTFAATLHIRGRSSIRNLRTHHAIVTGTHLSHGMKSNTYSKPLKTMAIAVETVSMLYMPGTCPRQPLKSLRELPCFRTRASHLSIYISRLLAKHYIKTIHIPIKKTSSTLRPIKDDLCLKTSGVYCVSCECGKVYVGQTSRTI
jgi:hypothetical protein